MRFRPVTAPARRSAGLLLGSVLPGTLCLLQAEKDEPGIARIPALDMTRYLVFIAMALSIYVLRKRGIEQAVLRVWLPFFLLMPFSFFANIPGLPDPNFMEAAILPILFVLLRDRLGNLHFGRMETLILLYTVLRVFLDYLSRGYSDAQNYAFFFFSSLIGPFLIGRYVINRREMDIEVSRMFVLIFILSFPMFIYELKIWTSPVFTLFGRFFPGAGSGLSLRYGVARTAGTFEHPILACIMVIAVYRLHRWLAWSGYYSRPQRGWMARIQHLTRWIPIPFRHQISIVLILMALMTISRGPWIGGFAGAALAAVGNFKKRKLWLKLFTAGLLCGAIAGQIALDAYITPKEGEIISGEALTMLYRKEMVERYKAYMLEKVWTGWGLTTRPKIPGMESIDNAFFLMALQHGILAPALFTLIFLYAILSQIKFGLKAPPGKSPIGFTFSGIYLMCFISFATVYMGAQTEPMLFLLLGWGESIKNRKDEGDDVPSTGKGKTDAPTFKRIMY